MLNLCSKILAQAGYKALTAINERDALDIARACKHSIEVTLIDVMMPGMSGLAERLVKLHPEASLVFMSGYQDYQIAKFRPFAFKWFLRKPFKPTDVIRLIQQPLEEDRRHDPSPAKEHHVHSEGGRRRMMTSAFNRSDRSHDFVGH